MWKFVHVQLPYMLLTNRRFQIAARPKLNTTDGNTDGDVVDVGSICALCKYSRKEKSKFRDIRQQFQKAVKHFWKPLTSWDSNCFYSGSS